MDEASLLSRCYSGLATMLGCDAEEIAVVQSATIAWQAVCYGIPFKPGDKILTSMAEYGSNYIGFLQICKRTGAEVSPNPPQPSPNSFERLLRTPPPNTSSCCCCYCCYYYYDYNYYYYYYCCCCFQVKITKKHEGTLHSLFC